MTAQSSVLCHHCLLLLCVFLTGSHLPAAKRSVVSRVAVLGGIRRPEKIGVLAPCIASKTWFNLDLHREIRTCFGLNLIL